MGIVQTALSRLLAPSVAETVSAALGPIRERVSALEDRPALTEADRVTLDKAAQMVAEFEALAEGEIAAPAAADPGGSITVTDVTP